jgi:hypothetical protein
MAVLHQATILCGGHDDGMMMNQHEYNTSARRRSTPIRHAAMAATTIVLALGSWQARADWVRVSASQQSFFYIDSQKSQRVGDNVMIWVLRDHKAMQASQSLMVRSSRDQIEVDCVARRIRRIFSSDHGRPMGKGPMVHSEHGPMSWNTVPPNSTVSRIVDVACANT